MLDGAACAACGAPLGSAARYCLSCGARQAGARTELLDLVPVASASPACDPSAAPTAVVPAVVPVPVSSAPSAAAVPPVPPASVATLAAAGPRTWPFAVTAAVLVALVVGLGLGRLLADGRGGAGDPQVIRIEGAGGVATEAPAAEAPATEGPATSNAPAAEAAPPAGEGAASTPTPASTVPGGTE